MPCPHSASLPSRFVVRRCPACALVDLAPMTGAERAERIMAAPDPDPAPVERAVLDYAEIRARALPLRRRA